MTSNSSGRTTVSKIIGRVKQMLMVASTMLSQPYIEREGITIDAVNFKTGTIFRY